MTNWVICRFSLHLQLYSVVLKSVPVKYIATYCPWDLHQIHRSCTSMGLWWHNNPSLWLSWVVSIPKWVLIVWHAACAPSDAKLLEGGVCFWNMKCSVDIVKLWKLYISLVSVARPCCHFFYSRYDTMSHINFNTHAHWTCFVVFVDILSQRTCVQEKEHLKMCHDCPVWQLRCR